MGVMAQERFIEAMAIPHMARLKRGDPTARLPVCTSRIHPAL